MPASLEVENVILHQDDDALVTPSWLTLGGTSYAIRTIIRLDYRAYIPPTTLATVVFCCALILIIVCLWYLFGDVVPALLAWTLLIASTVLMLYSAWYAFTMKPHYQVLVTFLSGSPIQIRRNNMKAAESLHTGLTEAMGWHLGRETLINADQQEGDYPAREPSGWRQAGGAKEIAASTAANRRARQLIPFLSVLHQKSRD